MLPSLEEAPEEVTKMDKSRDGYTLVTAILQGTVMMLNCYVAHTFAAMVNVVLYTTPFGATMALSLHLGIVLGNAILLISNPLYPILAPISCFFSGLWYLAMAMVITYMTGRRAKLLYLLFTFMVGFTVGIGDLTSYALFTVVKGNHLPSFGFGLTLGAFTSFAMSTLFKTFVYPEPSVHHVYKSIVAMTIITTLVGIVSGVNMVTYLSQEDVGEHLEAYTSGKLGAKFSFKEAARGFASCKVLLLVDAICILVMLSLYPGIVPSMLDISVNEKVILTGTVQVSITLARGYSVFAPSKLQVQRIRGIFMLIALTVVPYGYFIMLAYQIFPQDTLWTHLGTRVAFAFSIGTLCYYCITYSLKMLKTTLPKDIPNSTLVSTSAAFCTYKNVFRAMGSGISEVITVIFLYTRG